MKEMSDESINSKHVRIRGSLAYKYPAPEAMCKTGCGQHDDDDGRDHRCVLYIGHEADGLRHQWSWACVEMGVRVVAV